MHAFAQTSSGPFGGDSAWHAAKAGAASTTHTAAWKRRRLTGGAVIVWSSFIDNALVVASLKG
jgi:hypothetical protein